LSVVREKREKGEEGGKEWLVGTSQHGPREAHNPGFSSADQPRGMERKRISEGGDEKGGEGRRKGGTMRHERG
jgi:hypothetical protein